MDGPGMNMLAKCIEANVDAATSLHDQIIEGMQRDIDALKDEVAEFRRRESRMWARLEWLAGYGEDDYAGIRPDMR